jgi:prolyl oligopeptidase
MNEIAADGSVALTDWNVDPGARWVAYSLARGGSDRQELRIRTVDTGVDLPEVILWTKSEEDLSFSNVAWTPDGRGFYYSRLPAPGTVAPADTYRFSQIWWHALETSQTQDVLVFEDATDPDLNFVPIVTDDGAYLVLHAWRGLSGRHRVHAKALGGSAGFSALIPDADARYLFLGNEGDRFFFHTNAGAPRGRIIGMDLERSGAADWVEVVAEGRDPIFRAYQLDDQVAVVTVRDSHHQLQLFGLDGRAGATLEMPEPGTILDVAPGSAPNEVLVAFEAFLRPRETLRFDVATGARFGEPATVVLFDRSSFVTTQDFVPAADGMRIPVTVVHRADLVRDGRHPLVLYGYGGFNVSTTPLFDPWLIAWLERGGVYAIANPRGGGEYGEAWHEAGRRHAKETVFADFETVAEWLNATGYTSPERLAIRGESNGGLLVAACMLRRPDLFGAVVCSLPVTDMLRFPRYTLGHYWTPEYGDPVASADDFRTLRGYSPLQNVRPGADYPPILVTTGDGDDRVVPAHAMKFVATLQQAATANASPRLLRLQHGSGHGLGKPVSKIIDLDAEIDAFLLGTIGAVQP